MLKYYANSIHIPHSKSVDCIRGKTKNPFRSLLLPLLHAEFLVGLEPSHTVFIITFQFYAGATIAVALFPTTASSPTLSPHLPHKRKDDNDATQSGGAFNSFVNIILHLLKENKFASLI